MNLSNLMKLQGKDRRAKRVGRGGGSGKGFHTTGRGQKGQKSRTGFNIPVGFEGGQVPLYRKMPHKRGFVSVRYDRPCVLNISKLNVLDNDTTVTPELLLEKGLLFVVPQGGVKILGTGKLTKKLHIKGCHYSDSVKNQVSELGGSIEDLA